MIPKTKRAKVATDLRDLPADLHWVAVQTAVNSVLSKFKIKTKITIREEKPFLVVEATRKRSPRRSVRECGSIGLHVIKAQP